MSYFEIEGQRPLRGEVTLQGAKNSVLKLLAASLLVEGTVTFNNVPAISDVHTMLSILDLAGVESKWTSEHSVELQVPKVLNTDLSGALSESIRASIVAMGPLVARCGVARLAVPGGDDLGSRPIDLHIGALQSLGASVFEGPGWVEAKADRLRGADIELPFPSVGATENALMAALCAQGTTTIHNAAREPEIIDLIDFLNAIGGDVSGAGQSEVVIHGCGVESLRPAEHTVIADRIEAATFMAAVGCATGEIEIIGARLDHLTMLIAKLAEIGVQVVPTHRGITVTASGERPLRSVDVATLPYPGVATDYKPFVVTLLSIADGTSIVTENMFADRFRYFDELKAMGADIRVDAHHAVIRGVSQFHGATVKSHDIRGGAALVVAALNAGGTTVVTEAHHITRGYQNLAERFRALGAKVNYVAQ